MDESRNAPANLHLVSTSGFGSHQKC